MLSVHSRAAAGALLLGLLPALGGGCTGDVGDGERIEPVAFDAQPAVLPRLTEPQMHRALLQLFGEPLNVVPLEPDTNPFLFSSIGASSTPLSEHGVEQLEVMAESVTSQVFGDAERRQALVGCTPQTPGDDCVEQFLTTFGRRALRRPLTQTELDRWLGVSTTLADGDAWEGVRQSVAGLLQSASFVYRVELGEPVAGSGDVLLNDYELASRMAFLLWGAPPDDALLDAAGRGDLTDPDLREEQARRLLDDPRAEAAAMAFFTEYLDLGKLEGVSRDAQLYPQFTPLLASSMQAEVLLIARDLVFRQDSDIRQLFSTRKTFLNAPLAAHYGVEAPGASDILFVPVTLPDESLRAGILSLGAVLTLNAHEASTSPTLRGKYLRERVLCDEVPPAPPDVSTVIEPEPGDPKTLREQLEQHRTNPACAGCHALMDPPGYLFEGFDAVGASRTTDNGYPVDTSGDLSGKPLSNAQDLAELLVDEPKVARCMVKQLYRHALGRLDAGGEAAVLIDIEQRFAQRDYRFRELLVILVTHESFRRHSAAQETP